MLQKTPPAVHHASLSRIQAFRRDLTGSRLIIVTAAGGCAVFLVWAALAHVDEVARGEGQVIPSSKSQLIQSAEAATVKDILVRSGEKVSKGQLLVRLDDTQSAAELGQIEAENASLSARAARLDQESAGRAFDCAPGMSKEACESERELQQIRSSALNSKRSAIAATVEQKRREMTEAQATIASLRSSAELAQKQVDMLTPMAAKQIVPETELLTARRELTEIQGKIAAAQEAAARGSAGIRQAQAEEQEATYQFRQQALDEANQLQAKLAVIDQSKRGAAGKLLHADIRSPADGIVSNVQVTTVGGFVTPGQKIMEVVPVGDKLLVEAKVRPSDIAFIRVGQPALVRVTAYDFSIYGGLPGKVVQVSADSIYDEARKEPYFSVVVETSSAFLRSGSERLPITPGMICNVDIVIGNKSVLNYMLKPVRKARYDALHER